ncbi:type II toxin-antitoxin system prevent-host-death family antitoxin [Streptomyces sp. H51]|uniref:type II toxin-antitoxin system prevent-host-death family antitoxin n=1 Tax=Streptomyces sp. H51 TaxID=3111770 RepID=UPI002D765A39|nr:type II toxin-antitoxin system prevent-host-death family antitoxin [Streptomyces sp. H51]
MDATYTLTDARNNSGKVVNEVRHGGRTGVITDHGTPVAAVIPIELLDCFQSLGGHPRPRRRRGEQGSNHAPGVPRRGGGPLRPESRRDRPEGTYEIVWSDAAIDQLAAPTERHPDAAMLITAGVHDLADNQRPANASRSRLTPHASAAVTCTDSCSVTTAFCTGSRTKP